MGGVWEEFEGIKMADRNAVHLCGCFNRYLNLKPLNWFRMLDSPKST
jgi:hypothetical protein